jgi:hypothetical protein
MYTQARTKCQAWKSAFFLRRLIYVHGSDLRVIGPDMTGRKYSADLLCWADYAPILFQRGACGLSDAG